MNNLLILDVMIKKNIIIKTNYLQSNSYNEYSKVIIRTRLDIVP